MAYISSNSTLILKLPAKFIDILQQALHYRIEAMQRLIDDPNTPENALAKIDYGND